MVRSAADMRAEYVLGAESKEAPTGVQNAKRGKKGTAKGRKPSAASKKGGAVGGIGEWELTRCRWVGKLNHMRGVMGGV